MTIPDTSEAAVSDIQQAIYFGGPGEYEIELPDMSKEQARRLVEIVLAAHRKAVADAGGVELMPGEVPSWMKQVAWIAKAELGLGPPQPGEEPLYRLTTKGEDS